MSIIKDPAFEQKLAFVFSSVYFLYICHDFARWREMFEYLQKSSISSIGHFNLVTVIFYFNAI